VNQTLHIRIQEQHDALTKSERRVATAVLLHQNDLAQFSLDDLARIAGTSKATVARLFKKLGYERYREARYERGRTSNWAMTPLDQLAGLEHAEDLEPTLATHIQLEISNLTQTVQEIRPEDVKLAVESLLKASCVWVLGLRGQSPQAALAHLTLGHVLDNVRTIGASSDISYDTVFMRKGEVLLAIGARRRTKQFKVVMKYAKAHGVQVILLSDLTATESLKYADIVLRCHCKAQYYPDSHTTFVSVINFLVAGIALKKGQTLVARHKRIEELHEKFAYFGELTS
jgi:DNA-binding MurR/RpiR family transcriptional regulator